MYMMQIGKYVFLSYMYVCTNINKESVGSIFYVHGVYIKKTKETSQKFQSTV